MNCYLYLLLPWCLWYLIPYMLMSSCTKTPCLALLSSKNMASYDFFLMLARQTVKEYSTTDLSLFLRKACSWEVSLPHSLVASALCRGHQPPRGRGSASWSTQQYLLCTASAAFSEVNICKMFPYFLPPSSELFNKAWVALFYINQLPTRLVCLLLPSNVSCPCQASTIPTELIRCFREILCFWP